MSQHQLREGLPAHAKLAFKGVIFEVWQWEQEMFDGTKAIFEKIWRPATVEVLATVGDKILIEEQDQPDRKNNITFPGGRMDEGEDPFHAAKRELFEETGYQSEDWQLLLRHGKDGKVIHEIFYFIARNCKRSREPNLDAGEKIETRFVTFDDLLRLVDEPRFWISPEARNYFYKVQSDKARKLELQKLLFQKHKSS